MDDLRERLSRSLGDRYEIAREVGRGGMAVVFLAHDRKHDRNVALKVLRPELAESLAAERFLREIKIAAGLHHPHILALYDSGAADGHLFFVTPFVEGQTVRDRLNREERLPIDDALSIAEDVLSALAYSHANNVVHRDIKPDNILLVGGEAIVADFGIAKAIEEAGDVGLTQSGLALGTSTYMAPEQAEGVVNARSDIYSLGCTLYETLVGRPPFTGPTVMAMLAQHQHRSVPSMREVRSEITPALEDVVGKALAKSPAERYATAEEMLAAVRALRSGEVATGPRRRPSRNRNRIALIAAAVVVAAVGTLALRQLTRSPVLEDVVAVMPFSLRGAVDTSLLSPTLAAELLYTRLSGENGPRIVEPRAAFGVAQAGSIRGDLGLDELLAAARKARARRMVAGRITAVGRRLNATATLYDVRSGAVVATVETAAPPDSVLAMFDVLAAQLLIREVRQSQSRLGTLLTEQLSALRPYLSGLRKYRSGQYQDAAADFELAIQMDSSFALAAMELSNATAMVDLDDRNGKAENVAWTHRDRLSGANRLYLSLLLGRNFPAPTAYAEQIRGWEIAIDTIPERWEASYFLGDLVFHWGAFTGITEWESLSRNNFERARAADSLLAPALEHLLELAVLAGDSAAVRRWSAAYLAAAPRGDDAPYVRWKTATYLGDAAQRASVMANLSTYSEPVLKRMIFAAELSGTGLDDAMAAATELHRRATDPKQLYLTVWTERELLLNLGRPQEALRRAVDPPGARALPLDPFFRVIEAIYWDGDSSAAATLARTAETRARLALAASDPPSQPQSMDVCTAALWHLRLGQLDGVDRFVKTLRAFPKPLAATATSFIEICAALIDAELSTRTRPPASDRSLMYLDSLMRSGPATNPYMIVATNLALAQMFERRGDVARALSAVRRRPYVGPWGTDGLSSLLREEGRLAAIAGDTAGAIKAYSHYLRLREHPEASLAPEVARVRQSLDRLRRYSEPRKF